MGTSTCPYSGNSCDQIHDLAFWNNMLLRLGLERHRVGLPKTRFTRLAIRQRPWAVSADSTQTGTGILWAITPDSILNAFNAGNVASELWNSNQHPGRDALPSFPKFVEPTVANGPLYVATIPTRLLLMGC